MDEAFLSKLREKIKPYFEGINVCHDLDHTERVVENALMIGKNENANLEILEVAALLHDIARKEQDESRGVICHAERGGVLAREILEEMNYPEEKIKQVVHCVETHRFRKGNPPETLEARIIYDADKLDNIGAIGIARAISFSGHRGSKVHLEESQMSLEDDEEYGPNDCAYREYLVKLQKVKDKMLTETCREMAKERHEFMIVFFDRINKEIKGEL